MGSSRIRTRGITARTLASALAVVTFWGTTALQADPADIFTVGAPAIGSAPPKAADVHNGDASVSATGALEFSYPIAVPPGRHGMQPGIALSYSSQGPIYGTLASGWSLTGLPTISLDTSRGRLWTMVFNPPVKEYKSDLGGGRPLVSVSDIAPPTGADAYRAQNDATFTRYQRFGVGTGFTFWRALSPDGTTYYFGGDPDLKTNHFVGCTTISDEYAPIAQTRDSFNNVVDYFYEAGAAGECRIAHIDWGKNQSASIAHFASLSFRYSSSPPSCAGVAVGSQSSYRTGTQVVTGASQLDSIVASVGTPAEYVRTYSLTYNASTANSTLAACFRQLDSIQESAVGANVASVTLPAVKFGYGAATFAQAPTTAAIQWPSGMTNVPLPWPVPETSTTGNVRYNLGWGFRFKNDQWPSVEAMMVDVDGDGLVDRLISYPLKDSAGHITACGAAWERNRGPGLGFDGLSGTGQPSRPISMPTIKWHNGTDGGTCTYQGGPYANSFTSNPGGGAGDDRYVESCSLNYQLTSYRNADAAVGASAPTPSPTYLAYRWFDINHDGKVDLIASPSTGSVYNLVQGTGRQGCTNYPPPPEPNVFGIPFPACPTAPFTSDPLGRYTMCSGMYPWAVFLNHGNGQFGTNASGAPVADYIRYQPVPLESTAADSSITSAAVGQNQGTVDLDGDGAIDGVHVHGQGFTSWDVYRSEPLDTSNPGQLGYRSIGNGAYGFAALAGELLSQSLPQYLVGVQNTQGLLDINGDGLVDQWTGSGSGSSAVVELNDGTRFGPASATVSPRPGNNGVAVIPTGCSGCVITGPSGNQFIVHGHRFDSSRTLDADLDGRVDVISEPDENYPPTTALNEGASFLPTTSNMGSWLALRHQLVVSDQVVNPAAPSVWSYSWEIRSDMLDLDGDGIPEGIYFVPTTAADGTGNAGQMQLSQVPTPTQPPRLLVHIDAQRGAVTDISYAAMSNPNVVEQHPELNKGMPQTQWVVQSLTTTNNLPTPSATVSTTSYKYINPHFGPDDRNSYGFRGFEEVDTTLPSGAKHIDRYAFDPDWSGRLRTSLVVPKESPNEVRSIDETTWQALTLFGGAITTYHAQSVDHWTCNNGQTEALCRKNTDTFTHTQYTYLAKASDTVPPTPLMWKQVQSRLQGSTTAADGDRVSDTTYYLYADADNYRLVPQSVVQSWQDHGSLATVAKVTHDFDGNYKVAVHDNVWTDSNAADVATTMRVYDMNTGNVLQRWKPEQFYASVSTSGDRTKIYPEYYTYDARALFVTHVKTEPVGYGGALPREQDFTYDTGTGTKIDVLGPNKSICSTASTPYCVQGALTREEHKLTIDALGRVLTRSQTIDNGVDYGTALHTLEINSYVDTSPQSVTHQAALDKDGNWNITYSQDRTDLDGLGRPMKKTVFVFGSAPADAVTTYHWANDGTLTSIDAPDPAASDASTVTYRYTFDSLGRAITMTRPDGGSPASGVTIAYNGLQQTTTEQTGQAGGYAASTRTTKDQFGRLKTVEEQISASRWVQTAYGYDGADRVNAIVDPEGVHTSIGYDLAGRRTSITRVGLTTRVWTYGYDLNGNMVWATTPCTGTGCAATHTTTIAYDNLDEPTSKRIAPRDMTPTDVRYFGVDHEQFRWDYLPSGGGNSRGYLAYWLTYGSPTGSAAKVETSYGYNSQGGVTSLWHLFDDSLGGYPAMSRHPTFNYHLSGAPSAESFADAVGGSNLTSITTSIDRRGLPSQMYVNAQPRAAQTIAVATRNVAGLVTKQRTDQTGAMPFIESDWTYDHLGRVTTQQVLEGPASTQVVRQDLAYLGNDDPKSLDHWLGATNHKQFTYGFDWRHQLTTVDETLLPHAFTATYAYGDAGRFTTATENVAALPGSDVKARNVAYHYDGTDPEEVTSLTNGSGSAPYAVYTYDDEGNQTSRCYGGTSGGVCTGESLDYLYDGKDQLRRATKKSAGVVQGSEEYWYDDKGNRVATVKRDASGNKTELIWFIGNAEAHYDGTGALTHVYSYLGLGGPAVARIDRTGNASTSWEYLFHGLGNSTLAAVDRDTGLTDASFDYAPFGEIVESTDAGGSTSGVAAHPQRMNDKYVDAISDLAYYGVRYYDKTLVGWTQADPLFRFAPDARWTDPRRGNLYAFSLNNSLRYIDPDGRNAQPARPAATLSSIKDPAQVALEGERANEHEDDDLVPVDDAHFWWAGSPGAVVDGAVPSMLDDLCNGVTSVCEGDEDAKDEVPGETTYPWESQSEQWGGSTDLDEETDAAHTARAWKEERGRSGVDDFGNRYTDTYTDGDTCKNDGKPDGAAGLNDLARMRSELGLAEGKGTLARLDAGGSSFYGINAHGQPVTLRVNAITLTHAEADAFQQAANALVSGGRAILYVDRALCPACGNNGGVRGMMRQLGFEELQVITPQGTQVMRP